MTRKHRIEAGPAVIVALGILVSTAMAMPVVELGPLAIAAPLIMTASILAADLLSARLTGRGLRLSIVAITAAIALLVGFGIVVARDPGLVVVMMPIMGAGAGIAVLIRSRRAR